MAIFPPSMLLVDSALKMKEDLFYFHESKA